jgi:hypothetical protein
MDAFLALIIALLGFAFMIFVLSRSVKFIMAIGVCVIVLVVLNELGVLEMISW